MVPDIMWYIYYILYTQLKQSIYKARNQALYKVLFKWTITLVRNF